TTPADMAMVAEETRHVAGLTTGVGDPAPFTARGVCRAMQAVASVLWGRDDLEGRTVAIQGLGSVGTHLAEALAARGARLLVSDLDPTRVDHVVSELRAVAIAPANVVDVPVDIFAPCALGGVLDDETVPRLRAQAVVGAANNQLLEPRHGDALAAREILYIPDYAANAGGVISGSVDIAGWDRGKMEAAIDRIYDTVLEICSKARAAHTTPARAADRMVEDRIAQARQR
ncbi:MAG: Glu/Leu/Phe/Val dehydrogenase family protein, partial [Vicinamibacterales bacterium]